MKSSIAAHDDRYGSSLVVTTETDLGEVVDRLLPLLQRRVRRAAALARERVLGAWRRFKMI